MYIVAVNDGAVMNAWKKDQGLGGSDLIEFVADTSAELTVALDLVLTTHPGPAGKLGAHTPCAASAAPCSSSTAS